MDAADSPRASYSPFSDDDENNGTHSSSSSSLSSSSNNSSLPSPPLKRRRFDLEDEPVRVEPTVTDNELAVVFMPNGHRLTRLDWNRIHHIVIGKGLGFPQLCPKEECDFCAKFELVHHFYTETIRNIFNELWFKYSDDTENTNFLQWLPRDVMEDVFALTQQTSGNTLYHYRIFSPWIFCNRCNYLNFLTIYQYS